MSGFSIPAPFPRLAGLAANGRLPQSLLLSGPSGAPTVEAAIALSAIVNSSDRDPESEATRVLHQRIVGTDSAFRTGGAAGGGSGPAGGTGPAGGPYPDVRILRPESGKPIRVDEVRQAIAAVRTHPFEGRRRVLVIEAADTMNPPAANALLKTLEEPHPWLGLILCATREAALLPTIVSRCQRWRFAAPTTPEVAARLREAHDYPPEEAVVAAAAARGDLARALALPRDRLLPLAEEAERMAAIVGRGIAPPARTVLTERLMKASPRSRKPGHIDELQTVLVLLRATLRDLAALRSEGAAVSGDPGHLRKIAELAPGSAFAEALLLVEETDRNMYRSYGNKRMQLDALLLAFNEIARPLVVARMRTKRAERSAGL